MKKSKKSTSKTRSVSKKKTVAKKSATRKSKVSKRHLFFGSIITVGFALITLLITQAALGKQNTVFNENLVNEPFDRIKFLPEADAYWNVQNWGYEIDQHKIWADTEGSGTNVRSYVDDESETENRFARFTITNDITEGVYSNVELSDKKTGFESNKPGKWLPDRKTQIEFEARVRWSENYQADGSGSNVGSSGIWFWNSPYSFNNPNDVSSFKTKALDAIGFSWHPAGSKYGSGLTANFIMEESNAGTQNQPIHNIDIHQWNTFKVVWKSRNNIWHDFEYFVNGTLVMEKTVPALSNRYSVVLWNNNLVKTNGSPSYPIPPDTQYMDVDYIKIQQL